MRWQADEVKVFKSNVVLKNVRKNEYMYFTPRVVLRRTVSKIQGNEQLSFKNITAKPLSCR